jgi:glycosyltransferase involved in cell wall biosynthesis
LRLVMLMSGFPRRSETFALNELLALDRAGCLEAVFATKPGEDGPPQPGAEKVMRKVRVLAPGTPTEQAAEVVERLDGARVDAVHGYFAHVPTEVAANAARRLGVPYGFSVHAVDARKVSRSGLAERARAAACVIACNPDVAGDLRRAGAPVQLMPHGVDLERFRPTPPPPAEVLTILAVGRLVEKKGFPVLLEAAAQLLAPVRVRIVGDGAQREELERRIADLGLTGRVELAGPATHDDLPAEYAAAHIVVVPSIMDASGDRDGLPNVVLEAMSCGRPVVASDVGAVSSAVVDGRTGVLVPPGDAEALAGALEFLVDQPDMRERLGREARARVEADFELNSCTARLRAFLETVYA